MNDQTLSPLPQDLRLYLDFSVQDSPQFTQAAWGAAVVSSSSKVPLCQLGGPLHGIRLEETAVLSAYRQAVRLFPHAQWEVFVADQVTLQSVGEVDGIPLQLSYRTQDMQRFAHEAAVAFRNLLTDMSARKTGDPERVRFRVAPFKPGKSVALSFYYEGQQTALSFPEKTPDEKLRMDFLSRLERFQVSMDDAELARFLAELRAVVARRERTAVDLSAAVRPR